MSEASTFLFDGECGFCSSAARWMQRWIPTSARVEPWQRVDLAALGVTESECDAAVWWIGADGRRSSGPVAIADLLRTSRWWWRPAGRILGSRIGLLLAWPTYRWVSRNRGRLPGGTPECALRRRDPDEPW